MTPESPELETLDPSRPCPCGSGRTYAACCGPLHSRSRVAATAEELMRARYAAHVIGDQRFLHDTYEGTARQAFVPDPVPPTERWTRLVVHEHALGRIPELAYVDFSAYYTQDGREGVLHEKAEFVRSDGRWIYTRAVRLGPAPVRASGPKAGRNDPCPCGSGKKYKHCCLK